MYLVDDADRLPLAVCRPRTVYRVAARTLHVAVYTGRDGAFIGLQESFGAKMPFTEYHWDTNGALGTLSPLEPLGVVPDGVALREHDPGRCSACQRPTAFDRPARDGGRGWTHTDGSPLCAGAHSYLGAYRPLFDVLDAFERRLGDPTG